MKLSSQKAYRRMLHGREDRGNRPREPSAAAAAAAGAWYGVQGGSQRFNYAMALLLPAVSAGPSSSDTRRAAPRAARQHMACLPATHAGGDSPRLTPPYLHCQRCRRTQFASITPIHASLGATCPCCWYLQHDCRRRRGTAASSSAPSSRAPLCAHPMPRKCLS